MAFRKLGKQLYNFFKGFFIFHDNLSELPNLKISIGRKV